MGLEEEAVPDCPRLRTLLAINCNLAAADQAKLPVEDQRRAPPELLQIWAHDEETSDFSADEEGA